MLCQDAGISERGLCGLPPSATPSPGVVPIRCAELIGTPDNRADLTGTPDNSVAITVEGSC